MAPAPVLRWYPDPEAPAFDFNRFGISLAELDRPLPWHACEERYGTICDATGEMVAIVPPLLVGGPKQAYQLALLIVSTLNVTSGYVPTTSTTH